MLCEYLNSLLDSAPYGSTLRPNATLSQTPSRGTSSAKCLLLVLANSSFSHQVTIKSVSDEALLNIFRHFLDVSPRDWPRLVHTCRKWRHIAFASQRVLRLRLFCTYGTPVQKRLDCWPALPIVVQYWGFTALCRPTPEDEDNIMAALKQFDRIISITLTITHSLLRKLSTIERRFLELEDLVLLSRDGEPLTMPSAFRWGQRLRRLHLTGIAFPVLLRPQYLSSSTNIIDFRLHDAFLPWNFSLVILKNLLSEVTRLRSLSLHFRSITNYHFPLPPHGERVGLPILTHLDYRGSMTYLEGIVTIIDAPSLEEIEITSDNRFLALQVVLPKFKNFVDRIETHRSHIGAHMLSSEPTISTSLTQVGAPTRLKLQVLCKPFPTQIFSTAQLCLDFSPFLFNDDGDLHISTTRPPVRADNSHNREWLELLNKFTGKQVLYLDMNHSISVMHILQPLESQHEDVLPALHKLYVRQPGPRDAVLREAVVSFMISRRLSGHSIEVEYERQCDINKQWEAGILHSMLPSSNMADFGVGTSSQQETTGMLSEDVLHYIFRQYLDAFPQSWPMLVLVCQRWRQVVFTSPLGLNIRLHCTYRTPVLKALCHWPALPITIQYGGTPNLDPPAPEDDDNIITALKQSNRVSSIILTVTSSLLEKFSAISEPFTELEDLVIFSQDNLLLTFPSSFHLGPRLRTVHLIRIAIPSFPQLLSPSQFLVDIQLHEIPITGYFSPEAFANALSGTTQVRSLLLSFLSLPPRRNYIAFPPPSVERVVLPALTCLKYRGTSKYLDIFVARIDAPRLGEINITFFYQPTIDASQLSQFIKRVEMHTSLIQADVETSANAISISFTDSSASTPIRLQISCKQLDWQLFCMGQVCDQISLFLSHVIILEINTTQTLGGQDDVISEQWVDLLRSFKFSGVKSFWVASDITTGVLCALCPANEGDMTLLPSLRHVRVQKPIEMDGPLWDSVQSFTTSRWISGRPVEVKAPSYQCHICHGSSEEQQGLKRHLREKYGYQVLCSYCSEFECTPGESGLFREHLKGKHREVTRSDAHISKPSLTPFQIDSLVNRHSSLREPDVIPPSPTSESTGLHSPLATAWESDDSFDRELLEAADAATSV